MVLGDSFSERNLWQSVLSNGKEHVVKTYLFGTYNCIPNFLNAVIDDKTSKIVIMETVERSFIERFNEISSCGTRKAKPMEIKEETIGGVYRPTWPLSISFWYSTTTAINSFRSFFHDEKYSNRYMTVNTTIVDKCALLSNRRNNKLLYYAVDDSKKQWRTQEIQQAIANVIKIQNQVERSGKRFIFIIAPDKSSVYQECLPTEIRNIKSPNINEMLIASGVNTPNMQAIFSGKIETVVDLYDPDNTHWSEGGYILAGETIGHYLEQINVEH